MTIDDLSNGQVVRLRRAATWTGSRCLRGARGRVVPKESV